MSEPDETRRVDFEVLAWMLAVGVVGLACKAVPVLFAWRDAPVEMRAPLAAWVVQELAVIVVAVPIGLLTGRPTRLGARDVRAWIAREPEAVRRVVVDVLVATTLAAILAGLLVFATQEVRATSVESRPAYVAGIATASLGAGLSEEIVYRLGVMTLATWIAAQATRRPAGTGHVVFGLLVSALVFGGMHLHMTWSDALWTVWEHPNLTGDILKMIWFQILMGLACGALYWKRGIIAAIAAHALINVFTFALDLGLSR